MKSRKIGLCLLIQFWNILSETSNSLLCRISENGVDYRGIANLSSTNKPCKPWKVGSTKYELDDLQINNRDENFCRNPNNSSSVWCYIDANITEPCNVPKCLVNPKANYCIPIPTRDFAVCPLIFQHVNLFKQNISKEFQFCCLKNSNDSQDIPITDGCLLNVLPTKFLEAKFTLCPTGYHARRIFSYILEDKSVYKCCKYNVAEISIGHTLYQSVIMDNVNKSIPVFSWLTEDSCRPVHNFYSEVVEYFNIMKQEYSFLEPRNRLCFYYLDTMTDIITNNSELGLLSMVTCPINFIQLNNTKIFITSNSVKIKICRPNVNHYSYPPGQYCLLQLAKFKLKCPSDFHAYIIRSAVDGKELARFCCLMNNSTTILWLTQDNLIGENVSIAFVSLKNECPFMISNISMTHSIINASIKPITNLRETQGNFPKLKLCTYKVLIDRFAYKKVGEVCPTGMIDSWVTFTSASNWEPDLPNEIFKFEYCIGNALLKLDSFPKGSYCVFKIGNVCPLGFTTSSMSYPKTVINQTFYAPNYTGDPICCRNDGKNSELINPGQFPFLNDKNKTSFGLLIINRNEICPKIDSFVDHHEVYLDGFYCAYRTINDNYEWSNKIMLPIQISEATPIFKNRKHWKSLSNFRYIFSVILSYPRDQFCIVSEEKCSFMKNIDFAMFYPISKMFLCCSLTKLYVSNNFFPLKNYEKFQKIGFVAIHGKCPKINEEIYSFQSSIEEIFEIEKARLYANELLNFIKLGIHIDQNVKLNFIRIKYKFCIYRLSKDQIVPINLFGILKPLQKKCPNYFSEETHTISINRKESFQTIFPYFFKESDNSNKVYASFCFQKIQQNNHTELMKFISLCFFSFITCPKGFKEQHNELFPLSVNSKEHESLVICCNENSEISKHASSHISLNISFILPLKPGAYECPKLQNFSHEKLNSNKLYFQTLQYLNFCFYYKKVSSISWPIGNYLTISINNYCPPFFILLQHKLTSLCMRNEINTNQIEFPSGLYCLLSHLGLRCPLSGTMESKKDIITIENKLYLICCTQNNEIIFNIHIPEGRVFSFLSLDKCSIISGALVIVKPFANFSHIVQCIYISNCFNKSSKNCNESLFNKKDVSVNSHMLIITVLLIIMVIVTVIVVGRVVLSKIKKPSSMNHIKMEPFFSNTDMLTERIYSEVEKTSSVTYSTLS